MDKNIVINNQKDLEYFRKLQNSQLPVSRHSVEKWDQRAENWEKEYRDPKKSDERIQVTVNYLKSRGLLKSDHDVIDVGCGLGRFVAEFARTAHHVTGIDFSPNMIKYGAEYLEREKIKNASLYVHDFQILDIEKEDLKGKFDLVFCSNTPAIHGTDALEKLMSMSRQYCCYITHIHSENELESRIMNEIFGRERRAVWSEPWFYAIFNVLFLQGYYPEATYYKQHKEVSFKPDSGRVELFVEKMLDPEERNDKNGEKIKEWLKNNADKDGLVREASDVWSGRLLWNINEKSERAAYDQYK